MKTDLIRSRTFLFLPALWLGVFAALCVTAAYLLRATAYLENGYYDILLRSTHRAASVTDTDVLIASIDQASLSELGSWPWGRDLHARLIKKLADCGARVIGVDIIFSEAGSDPAADAALANAVARSGRVVMPLYYEETRADGQLKETYYYPMQALLDAGVVLGIADLRPDPDGVLRRLSFDHGALPERRWPYGVEIVRQYEGLGDDRIHAGPQPGTFTVGEAEVPLADGKNMYINFRGPSRSFPYLSYARILRGGYDPGLFKGKVVLIGATAPGLRTDHFHTPFTAFMPGVEVHANIIDAILKKDFIRVIPERATLALIAAVSLLAAFAFVMLGWKMALAVCAVFVAALYHVSWRLFAMHHLYLETVPLFLAVGIAYVCAVVYKDIYAERSVNVQHLDLHSLYQVGQETMRILKPQEVMEFILDMLGRLMRIDAAVIATCDERTKEYIAGAVRGAQWFTPAVATGKPCRFPAKVADLMQSRKEALILGSYAQRKRLLGDWSEVQGCMSSRVYVPLIANEKIVGILAVYKKKKQAFDPFAVQTLFIIASQVAIAIKNYELFDDLQKSFKDTVKGLVSALDEKDQYTRGHSERVARYAVAMGEELGFDRHHLESLEYAALLHDVGKIGVDLMILRKEKRLSDKEYDLLRHHTAAGANIISQIRFLAGSLPGIRSHHERYDGKGYPDGLKGDDIPIDGCIIFVADAFDAMTTIRAYNSAKPAAAALDILRENSGTQFHPRIVDTFVRVFHERFAANFEAEQQNIQPQEKYEDPSA